MSFARCQCLMSTASKTYLSDRIKYRKTQMLLATFAWGYTTNDISSICKGIFGIKSCLLYYFSLLPSRAGGTRSRIHTALPVNPGDQRSVFTCLSHKLSPYLGRSP